MQTTSLTVGGFNQPSVARSLIQLPGNAEKGLSQRFLWFFPKPVYGQFDTVEPINKNFVEKLGIYHDIKFKLICYFIFSYAVKLLSGFRRKTPVGKQLENRVFTLPQQSSSVTDMTDADDECVFLYLKQFTRI